MTALSIEEAVAHARRLASSGERRLLGITGPPGGGKSTLASLIAEEVGERARLVRMDGFHLAQAELVRLGRGGPQGRGRHVRRRGLRRAAAAAA